MSDSNMNRRRFLTTTGAATAGLTLAGALPGGVAAPHITRGQSRTVKAVSSANGLDAARIAVQRMMDGTDPLDSAIAGVNTVENDPDDITVGYGGLPNEEGVVELDAAVMHGPTHRAGAVASLRNIKNPSLVARLVMQQTDHVLLVGEGALRFARAHGIPEEELLTERSRRIWLYWKQTMSGVDDWLAPPKDQVPEDVRNMVERITGTVHLSARNAAGDLSCVTSTSGLFFKIPGRVGDSPIVGAGLYCDNDMGSAGSTGRGEANLQNLCSFQAVQLMGRGSAPVDAGMEVLRNVAKNTHRRDLLDGQGRPDFNLKFYLVNKDGAHAGVSMWGPMDYAVADENGARLEECAYLFERA